MDATDIISFDIELQSVQPIVLLNSGVIFFYNSYLFSLQKKNSIPMAFQ